ASGGSPALQGALRRGEEHQDRQILRNVVEAMLDESFHEEDGAWCYVLCLLAGSELAPARDNVINLVLGVRLLPVVLPGLEVVHAHAQGSGPQKPQPRFAGALPFRQHCTEFESPHGTAPGFDQAQEVSAARSDPSAWARDSARHPQVRAAADSASHRWWR